jgi:hypothetical protein
MFAGDALGAVDIDAIMIGGDTQPTTLTILRIEINNL